MNRCPRCSLIVAWTIATVGTVLAAGQASAQAGRPTSPVAACTIDGVPIYAAEVESMLNSLQKTRKVRATEMDKSRAEILKQLVDRRLAAIMILADGAFVNKLELEKGLEKVRSQAKAQRLTLEQYAAKMGVGAETYKYDLVWQIGWSKFLENRLSDALEGYFNEHKKDFDGTLVRASHILLRPQHPAQAEQVKKEAEKIRQEIVDGKITFEQAVEKFSVAPSRHSGGDVGYFPRRDVMVDSFSKTAFKLEKDAISEPVTTAFGIHLIRVTDIKPGTRPWTQSAQAMRPTAAVDLFEKLVDAQREKSKIEYTGKVPYFDPDTKELIVKGAGTSTAKATE